MAINRGLTVLLIILSPAASISLLLISFLVGVGIYQAFWPLPLVTAIGLILAAAVLWIRRIGGSYPPSRRLTIGAHVLLALNLLVLPAIYPFVAPRAKASFDCEAKYLERLGQAFKAYADDYDDALPPATGWSITMAPYCDGRYRVDPAVRPTLHECPSPAEDMPYYVYTPPRSGRAHDAAVIIAVEDWEEDMGARLYLHGSGRLEKRFLWPWWKYLMTGKYPIWVLR